MDSMAKCLQDDTIGYEDKVEITEIIAYTAQKHSCKYYRESMTADLLDFLLINLNLPDKGLIMLTHKIFHLFLDRHSNLRFFAEPVYFFKGRSDFVINYDFNVEDAQFFK